MSGKAARILVSEKQHEELLKITNARTASQRLIQRARIILLDFITCFNNTFARPFIWNYNGRHVKTHSIKRPNSLHR